MATAAAAGEGKELRLAGHFPLVDKSCKKPAAKFFKCFSVKADQPPEGVRRNSRLPTNAPHGGSNKKTVNNRPLSHVHNWCTNSSNMLVRAA